MRVTLHPVVDFSTNTGRRRRARGDRGLKPHDIARKERSVSLCSPRKAGWTLCPWAVRPSRGKDCPQMKP
jgi:hypothetical protein